MPVNRLNYTYFILHCYVVKYLIRFQGKIFQKKPFHYQHLEHKSHNDTNYYYLIAIRIYNYIILYYTNIFTTKFKRILHLK